MKIIKETTYELGDLEVTFDDDLGTLSVSKYVDSVWGQSCLSMGFSYDEWGQLVRMVQSYELTRQKGRRLS